MIIRSICFSGILLCTNPAFADQLNLNDAINLSSATQPPASNSSAVVPIHASMTDHLTLEQVVKLAAQHAPQVQAERYRQEAATADSDRAGRLPDPQLQFGTQNLDMQGSGAFNPNADAMTMRFVGVSQDIPSSAARAAEQAKAHANQGAAAADTQEARFRAKRDAATAWVDLWVAQRAETLLMHLLDQNQVAIDVARARLTGANGTVTDVLAARAASVELDNQLEAIRGAEQEAYAALARWVGPAIGHVSLSAPPDFSQLPVPETRLLQKLDIQAPLLSWASRVSIAEADLQRAKASKQPDWTVGFSYGLRAPGLPALGTFQIGMRLPLFADHRENRDIDARHADLEAVRADREDARRAQTEIVERSLARWQSLSAQVLRDESTLLPLASDRTRTALAAYRGGGSLEPWLVARSAEIGANLSYINMLAARARAWTELAYLIPENLQ